MIFNLKFTTALFLVTASALQQTGVSAESKSLRSRVLDSSYGSTESGKTIFSPKEIAAAWKKYDDGKYKDDCVNAMAIALGEGINPSQPLNYICDPKIPDCKTTKKGCLGFPNRDNCWQDWIPHQVSTVDEFLDAPVFDINQKPKDGQKTPGPWQTSSDVPHTDDINVRIREAVEYVTNTCKCPESQEGSACHPDPTLPVTMIFSDPPQLKWCGCPQQGSATLGYSGRCSHHTADFYTKYQNIATTICARA